MVVLHIMVMVGRQKRKQHLFIGVGVGDPSLYPYSSKMFWNGCVGRGRGYDPTTSHYPQAWATRSVALLGAFP